MLLRSAADHNLKTGIKLHRKLTVIETVPNRGQWNYL
jgi:hypothetical protein